MNAEGVFSGINPVEVALQGNGGFDSGGGSIWLCRVALIQLNAVDPEGHGVVVEDQIRNGDGTYSLEIPGCGNAGPFGCDRHILELHIPAGAVRRNMVELKTDFPRAIRLGIHGERIFPRFRRIDFRKREFALHFRNRHDEFERALSVRGSRGVDFRCQRLPVFRTGFFMIVDGSDSGQPQFEAGILNRIPPRRQQRQKSQSKSFSVHFIFPFYYGLASHPVAFVILRTRKEDS